MSPVTTIHVFEKAESKIEDEKLKTQIEHQPYTNSPVVQVREFAAGKILKKNNNSIAQTLFYTVN